MDANKRFHEERCVFGSFARKKGVLRFNFNIIEPKFKYLSCAYKIKSFQLILFTNAVPTKSNFNVKTKRSNFVQMNV